MRKLVIVILFICSAIACKSPEARRPVSQQSGSYVTESIARNKELIAQEEAVIQKLIEKDSTHIYYNSDSGFWYTYVKQDTLTTRTPVVGDLVNFIYDIKTLSGTPILTTEDIGSQVTQIDQSNQELISGIRDGLKLIKEGETITFLFPSHKAYGYYGLEDKIGSNLPIQSTVTLLKIKDNKPK